MRPTSSGDVPIGFPGGRCARRSEEYGRTLTEAEIADLAAYVPVILEPTRPHQHLFERPKNAFDVFHQLLTRHGLVFLGVVEHLVGQACQISEGRGEDHIEVSRRL